MAQKEETLAETTAQEPVQEAPKTKEIELFYTFVNNGNTVTVYEPGKHTLDVDTADDLLRRQSELMKSERDRMEGTDRSKGHIGRLG